MKNNYFLFEKFNDNEYLITNELGFFCFVDKTSFINMVEQKYSNIHEELIRKLKERMFIFDTSDTLFSEIAYPEYRKAKQYLFSGTCLHIFVLTNACNMNCVYCQAQDVDHQAKGLMDFQTAENAVEIALQSPVNSLNFEFQGGEPLLNFPIIEHIVEYAEEHKNDKKITYSVVTNTLELSGKMIEFFIEHEVSVSTSLDGDKTLHDNNRPRKNGQGTFKTVIDNIEQMKRKGISVGAIQTTTKNSLKYAKQIVETYLQCGLENVFIRPLTPLGYARKNWDKIGYTVKEFLIFYEELLDYILQLNKKGRNIREGHSILFLNKILGRVSGNYMELRSPCGAGIGQMAYYYDGAIFTCDEGRMLYEMGNDTFQIGKVNNSTYQSIMDNRITKLTCQSSILEAIPQCCDCVYHPFCGVCPVVNLASCNNIYVRVANSYRCQIYKGMLDILFKRIYDNAEELAIFNRWIQRA